MFEVKTSSTEVAPAGPAVAAPATKAVVTTASTATRAAMARRPPVERCFCSAGAAGEGVWDPRRFVSDVEGVASITSAPSGQGMTRPNG